MHACDGQTDRQMDGQTDRQTDRILMARPRLHCMQRGKKSKNNLTGSLYVQCIVVLAWLFLDFQLINLVMFMQVKCWMSAAAEPLFIASR